MSSRPSRYAVAFATHAAHPAIEDDEHDAVAWLAARGCTAEGRVWSDSEVDWARFDAVVIRSCWDYYLRGAEFLRWLARLEALGLTVLNPLPVLRSNLDKRYLLRLASAGLPVVPTCELAAVTESSLATAMDALGGDRFVLKPVMSAGAHQTWRLTRAQLATVVTRYSACDSPGPMLLQTFIEDIENSGELSLLYFGGQFSHAVSKRPRAGDFRVQKSFGGTVHADQAPQGCVALGSRALCMLDASEACYARVDMVNTARGFAIMEVELLEPDLYLRFAPPQASQALATVILRALQAGLANDAV